MRIAIVRSAFSPFGGVEMFTLEMIRALLADNHHVVLLTWPQQEWPLHHPNLQLIELGGHWGTRLWQTWQFEQSVSDFLHTHHFEIVFALDRVSTFTHFHGGGGSHQVFLDIKNKQSSATAKWFRSLSLFHHYTLHIEKKGFTNARLQKVHCCSQMVAADLENHYPQLANHLQVIPNGIPWQKIGNAFARRAVLATELSSRHGLPPGKKYLLFLGSGFERKGLDVAIHGLSFLSTDFVLVVVGKGNDGPYRRLAGKLSVTERLHFLGPVQDGWQLAACCQAAVLPSRYEPFGLAAAEAQAMGIPVLVSGKTGFAEWINSGENGIILSAPENAAAVQEAFLALQHLLAQPVLTAEAIRQRVASLDNGVIMHRLINDFLLARRPTEPQ